jgi:hypothetical protein
MKKELLIIVSILIILTIIVHYDELLTHPIMHIFDLPKSGAYGLGGWHPLIFALVVYILVLIPRFLFKLFKRNSK